MRVPFVVAVIYTCGTQVVLLNWVGCSTPHLYMLEVEDSSTPIFNSAVRIDLFIHPNSILIQCKSDVFPEKAHLKVEILLVI